MIVALVTIALAATAVALGRWQLRRLAARQASNATLIAAQALPALDLADGLARHVPLAGRRITARGTFDPGDQILLRDRVQDEAPGLQIVTPFVLQGTGQVLWVLRGFVAAPDAVTPPATIPAPVSTEVAIAGIGVAVPEGTDSGRPLVRGPSTTWMRLDRAALRQRRAGSLDTYMQLLGDSTGPGRLATVPLPALDNGPHLSYAIQWFGIATAILAFGVMVLWRDGRGPSRHPAAP